MSAVVERRISRQQPVQRGCVFRPIVITDDLHKRFKIHCVIAGQDMSQVVRKLIEEYLEQSQEETETQEN